MVILEEDGRILEWAQKKIGNEEERIDCTRTAEYT
jgi:hypothetical protein